MPELSEPGTVACNPKSPLPSVRVPELWPSLLLAFAATCITVGIMWDISWHETIGRDTFWTPAQLAIHLGGVLGGWLAIQYTFFAGPGKRPQRFGASARAPR